MRMGWVADTKILAYMYQISPPVPATDIRVVGVNLNLLANKNVDPRAIAALLPVLYSPHISSRFSFPISEDNILTPSGFPISDGTELYISSKQPFMTAQFIDHIKVIFGLVMSLLSVALVVFKWFKAPKDDEDEPKKKGDDDDDAPSIADQLNNITSNISRLE